MIFARKKIHKIPEFYMIVARKMPDIYIIIARKIFFPNFKGARAPPPAPVSYANVNDGDLEAFLKSIVPTRRTIARTTTKDE